MYPPFRRVAQSSCCAALIRTVRAVTLGSTWNDKCVGMIDRCQMSHQAKSYYSTCEPVPRCYEVPACLELPTRGQKTGRS